MKKRKSKSGTTRSHGFSFIIKMQSVFVLIYLSIFISVGILSLLLNIEKQEMFYVSVSSFALSSFVCGYIVSFIRKKDYLLNGLLFTLPLNLLICFVSALTNSFRIDLTLLFSFLILIISGMLGGLTVSFRKQKPKVRMKRG